MAASGGKDLPDDIYQQLSTKFDAMMRAMFRQHGATFSVSILTSDEAQDFVRTHAAVLDSAFSGVEMSDLMRSRLQSSDYIFSGLKTFHELNEAFPSLLDSNGQLKPFEQFLNDVRSVDNTYNRNYLRSEYNFAGASAEMAAKWERFTEDGDRYYLQYRTVGDDRVRPEHQALHGVTLPVDDPFWNEFFPPNGWNCRCTVAQVRKSKTAPTDPEEARQRGEEATSGDRRKMFRFNPGKEQITFPRYNPYTISRCRDCDRTNGKSNLSLAFVPEGQLCEGCSIIRTCEAKREHEAMKQQRKDLKQQVGTLQLESSNLQTGRYYTSGNALSRGAHHAYCAAELEMFKWVPKNLEKLQFVRVSPLGEGKDLNDERNRKNIENKRNRGVTAYNIYEVERYGVTWFLKFEVVNHNAETLYSAKIKQQ